MYSIPAIAQTDPFVGTWTFNQKLGAEDAGMEVVLEIGIPERSHLYPAQLHLAYGEFSGTYSLLLVKRDKNRLAIGRNKNPETEEPFSIGAWTVFINGYFNLQHKHGIPQLSIQRFRTKKYGVPMPALANFEHSLQTTALRIRTFLQDTEFDLEKTNEQPWMGFRKEEILHPHFSASYYGIMDTIRVNTGNGILRISDNTKIDDDTVSVILNNKLILDDWPLSRHTPTEIKLDTGLNILSFFAENYGRIPPSSGSLQVQIGKENFKIQYSNKADISSTVIVTKIYYYPDSPLLITQHNEMSDALLRTIKSRDSLYTTNPEITLAIWDDAVQDGDSISLYINDSWFVQGMLVTIQPQFFQIKLKPGPNDIVFVADNLGAISPNTSILEIIDKKRRKAFHINTNLRENNLVRIIYTPEDQ